MTRNSIEAEVLSRVLPTDAERAAAQAGEAERLEDTGAEEGETVEAEVKDAE